MASNETGAGQITISLRIRGRVQGVGFRWSLREQALRLALSGWVRNRLDGSVEALVCGPQAAVATLTDWAGKGPAGAQVLSVETQPGNAEVKLIGFEQKPTA
jgi:acylphosphatase